MKNFTEIQDLNEAKELINLVDAPQNEGIKPIVLDNLIRFVKLEQQPLQQVKDTIKYIKDNIFDKNIRFFGYGIMTKSLILFFLGVKPSIFQINK